MNSLENTLDQKAKPNILFSLINSANISWHLIGKNIFEKKNINAYKWLHSVFFFIHSFITAFQWPKTFRYRCMCSNWSFRYAAEIARISAVACLLLYLQHVVLCLHLNGKYLRYTQMQSSIERERNSTFDESVRQCYSEPRSSEHRNSNVQSRSIRHKRNTQING